MNAESSGQADAEATEPDAEIVDLPRINGSPGDSAVDRVTAWVRRSVLNGTMAPGSSFSITDLSEQLGVSAIPVREALRRLDAQGLILLRPGRSAIVNPLDVTELRGIYRLRRRIEPDLAARSCNVLESSDRDHLDSLLEAYGQPRNDAEELWRIHHDLHLALLQPAASAWDLRILSLSSGMPATDTRASSSRRTTSATPNRSAATTRTECSWRRPGRGHRSRYGRP